MSSIDTHHNTESSSLDFMSFPSPAKLNLFLHIVGQRADGYHQLETVFQFLEHGDVLEIKINNSDNIDLLTPIDGVDNDDNLIIKAAKLLKQNSNLKNIGAEIKINKVLPMGGGLGGGSSNAATVLLALNYLWKLNLPLSELAKLGLSLGADVPIFIHGFAAFAQGVGEKLTPVSPEEYWYLVSKPDVNISTQSVFTTKELTRNTKKLDFSNLNIDLCHNDCQDVVIKAYPKVAKLLAWLVEYAPSRMTGTGACIFTRFATEKEACRLQSLLPAEVESFVTRGLNCSPLHTLLQEIE
jgi:4-diphosphocytidyl-2-C-methyl-D-erythritol kinase